MKIRPTFAALQCFATDPTTASGVFSRLDKILRRSPKKPKWFFSNSLYKLSLVVNVSLVIWSLFIGVANSISLVQLDYLPKYITNPKTVMVITMVSSSLMLGIVFVLIALRRQSANSTIIISKRSESKSYVKRNIGPIIEKVIFLLIGAILAVIAPRIASYFFQNTPTP